MIVGFKIDIIVFLGNSLTFHLLGYPCCLLCFFSTVKNEKI